MNSKKLRAFCLPCLFGGLLLLSAPTLAVSADLLRLAVVGVVNGTDEAEFGKLLIAQGIAQLVAQELYDTGRYVPLEDNPEIAAQVAELLERSALTPAGAGHPTARSELGADALATVTIKKFDKSRVRGFMGPFSSAKVDIAIEVEVAVQEMDNPAVSGVGSGNGVTKSRGVLFQVREDQVHFDQTSVGLATQEAVRQAVAELKTQLEGGA